MPSVTIGPSFTMTQAERIQWVFNFEQQNRRARKEIQREKAFHDLKVRCIYSVEDQLQIIDAAYADALSRCRRLERRVNKKIKVLTK